MSFYTAIYFTEDLGVPNFHCTHKYFGESLSPEQIEEVVGVIDTYFASLALMPFSFHGIRFVFDQLSFFAEGSIVLEMSPGPSGKPVMIMGNLREGLDRFREDNFKPYRPHVTIGGNEKLWITEPLRVPLIIEPTDYRLIRWDGKKCHTVKSWPMK